MYKNVKEKNTIIAKLSESVQKFYSSYFNYIQYQFFLFKTSIKKRKKKRTKKKIEWKSKKKKQKESYFCP